MPRFGNLRGTKIVKSLHCRTNKQGTSYLGILGHPHGHSETTKNTLMKKFLFLGAFAIFALTASAQSTEAPADKKAKTEQTCSKDAKKASCEKTCDKSKSASCCSKGASASTDAKGATCSKSQTAGCCSAASASASTDAKKKVKKKKKGNKVAGLSGSN